MIRRSDEATERRSDEGSRWSALSPASLRRFVALSLLLWLAWPGVEVYADYSAVVVADTPYAYYRLGESSGSNAVDASGNSRDGTYTASPTLGVTGALTGDANTSITLASASSQYVSVPVSGIGAAMMSADAISFECWVKTTATAITNLFGCRSGNPFVQFRINANSAGGTTAGCVEINIRNNNATKSLVAATTGSVGINDGVWHHVVVTAVPSTNTVVIYIDGVSRGITYGNQQTVDGCTTTNAGDIGATNNAGSHSAFLNGSIDEVAIYTSVLTAAKVRTHYAAGLGILAGSGGVSRSGVVNPR